MTQEEKQLLIQVLCTLLPYGVQGMSSEGVVSPLLTRGEADWDILTSLNYRIVKHGWKPYLRPMSSMTEEEENEYHNLCKHTLEVIPDIEDIYIYTYYDTVESIDWLNAHHFDYRSLIPMGLALEATEGMYNN